MIGESANLVVPLWGALVAGFGALTTTVGVVVWVFANFERKADAKERHDSAAQRHAALEKRVAGLDDVMLRMSENVAWIRGVLEAKREA